MFVDLGAGSGAGYIFDRRGIVGGLRGRDAGAEAVLGVSFSVHLLWSRSRGRYLCLRHDAGGNLVVQNELRLKTSEPGMSDSRCSDGPAQII